MQLAYEILLIRTSCRTSGIYSDIDDDPYQKFPDPTNGLSVTPSEGKLEEYSNAIQLGSWCLPFAVLSSSGSSGSSFLPPMKCQHLRANPVITKTWCSHDLRRWRDHRVWLFVVQWVRLAANPSFRVGVARCRQSVIWGILVNHHRRHSQSLRANCGR